MSDLRALGCHSENFGVSFRDLWGVFPRSLGGHSENFGVKSQRFSIFMFFFFLPLDIHLSRVPKMKDLEMSSGNTPFQNGDI